MVNQIIAASRDIRAANKKPDPAYPSLKVQLTAAIHSLTPEQTKELMTYGDTEAAVREAKSTLRTEVEKTPETDQIRGALVIHLKPSRKQVISP